MNLTVKLALFFHDIGKPKTFSMGEDKVGHFYGHAKVSAEITEEILRRMKFDNNTIKDVCELVGIHDMVVNKELKFAKKLMGKIGKEQIDNFILVQECDKKAQTINEHSKETFECLSTLKENIQKILSEEQCYSLKDLSINGNDIKNLGIKEGKEIGEILQYLLDIVIENPDENNKENLLKLVEKRQNEKTFSEYLTK